MTLVVQDPSNEAVLRLWRERVVAIHQKLDDDSDKGGHDWHSLWAGFVLGLGRADLIGWAAYMKLGFPAAGEGDPD